MPDLLDDDSPAASAAPLFSLARLWADLRTYYLLLVALVSILFAILVVCVALAHPVYTATAIVGPADKSDEPFGEGAEGALSGGLGGIAKHLHVGGALGQEGTDDTFDEYTALLTSNRLLDVLVRKDHVLPEIFPDDWDALRHRWRPHDDFVHRTLDQAKVLLHRPIKLAPDQDDLQDYFKTRLVVDPSLETSFATVSLRFGSPKMAERLLGLILREADNIIREDKRRDVAARIAYLNTALEHLSLADQKPELIDVLSEQEQEMMMIESDDLYASTLIDMPYAPLKPTSPSPTADSAIALALACMAWLGVVRTVPSEGRWARFVRAFARPGRSRSGAARKRTPRTPDRFRSDPLAGALPVPGALDAAARSDVTNAEGTVR
ncbi:MAG TPA: hypothetical protein VHX61_07680 [Rhizomicrobium sp.]|jgi:hypothetical protein|nr:hypothetical protein [Rhizomicrobium sp.]